MFSNHKNTLRKLFGIGAIAGIVFTSVFFVFPVPAQAAIVPDQCQNSTKCGLCELALTLKNISDLMIAVAGPAAVLFLFWGAIMFMTSGGSSSRVSEAKKIATAAVIGLAIVLFSWVILNTLINVVFNGTSISDWGTIDCAALKTPTISTIPPPPTPLPPAPPPPPRSTSTATCSDLPALAAKNNVPYPARNAPQLDSIISCIRGAFAASGKSNWIGQIYTVEQTNQKCNYTRGVPICGNCAHAQYSCHYGGRTGSQGALGVDFNANLSVTTEAALCRELRLYKSRCGFSFLNYESNHSHISAPSCDVDQGKTGVPCP